MIEAWLFLQEVLLKGENKTYTVTTLSRNSSVTSRAWASLKVKDNSENKQICYERLSLGTCLLALPVSVCRVLNWFTPIFTRTVCMLLLRVLTDLYITLLSFFRIRSTFFHCRRGRGNLILHKTQCTTEDEMVRINSWVRPSLEPKFGAIFKMDNVNISLVTNNNILFSTFIVDYLFTGALVHKIWRNN